MRDDIRRLLIDAQDRLRQGRIDEALTLARRAAAQAPGVSECHNALGVILRASGRLDEAVDAYHAALAIDPDNARARNNLGDVHRALGDFDAAAREIAAALALAPDNPEALRNLALTEHARGRYDEAERAARDAMRVQPGDHRLYLILARIEHDRGAYAQAAGAYEAFLAKVPEHVEALTDLGMVYVQLNKDERALQCFTRALAVAPDHVPARFGMEQARANLIPPWHIPMMNEPQRNLAYREAIRALVQPGDLVLEIGTGAGLLAMMAAEAGARRVVTCEMVREVAAEARAIVARNGMSDRIDVVSAHSRELRVGDHLPGRADILISEILADDFVGEGVLPSVSDAMARLLKPDARVIPARGMVMGTLVGGEEIAYLLGLGEVCGFDVRSFARFRPWRQSISRKIDYQSHSQDTVLLDYDFRDLSTLKPVDTTVRIPVTQAGLCYGVLQWLRLELAPGVVYENHPRDTVSVWNKMLFAFPEPVEVKAGDVIDVRLWQHGDYLFVTRGDAAAPRT